MAQVFISYSRVDYSTFVELFIKRLQYAFPDLKIWHDQAAHGLIGGGKWWEDILQAIAASDVFIYILSNESVNSIYCQAEFAEARRLQKRIITIQARDRTDPTDDLDDIQFIDMKDGVDSPGVFPGLVAAVNLRLKEAEKYRRARPLWRPATPKPQKEDPLTRPPNAPDVTTPPLAKPTAEQEALRLSQQGLRLQTVLGVAALVVTFLVGFMALLPWLIDRAENAATTQTALAALMPTTAVPIQSPTSVAQNPTDTATLEPTLQPTPEATHTSTATLEFGFVMETYDANATIQQATADHEATLAARGTQYAVGTQSSVDQTATATLWTPVPTANYTASVQAYLTQRGEEATSTFILGQTATADSWTNTPTPSDTPTKTNTPTPTPTATLSPEQQALQLALTPVTSNVAWGPFEKEVDEVTMVLAPAGCFMLGSTNYDDEKPVHQQCFETPFWIDKYEVTNAQFAQFEGVAATSSRWTEDNRPREQITWFEARDYCAKRGARLPTEGEWEYAARGPNNLVYPWGNAWNADNAVFNDNSNNQTADVGSRPAGVSWIGAQDMSGNVWEWTSSLYRGYPYTVSDDRESDINSSDVRVLRGGSWFNISDDLRTANRSGNYPGGGSLTIGLRCARS